MADDLQRPQDNTKFVASADGDTPGRSANALAVAFTTLTRSLLDAATVADVLEQVVDAARRLVPGAELVSITVRSPDGVMYTPVETDPVATELDQVQYDTGEGPCVAAARPDGPGHVRSDDLGSEPDWPRFGPAAAAHGYHAVLSTALLPDARPPRLAGALNIYAHAAADMPAEAADIALLLATHASLALAGTEAVELAELREAQLHRAIESRDVIGQAKGILMGRRGINADEAFDLLRSVSQSLNVKIADLASTLATRHDELDPPSG